MLNAGPYRIRLTATVLVATVVVCICPSGSAQSDLRLGSVYYQVLYADKRLADLPKVPESNKGVQSVLRIATVGSSNPSGGVRILSTRRSISRQSSLDRTYRTQLTWDGKAWIGNPYDRVEKLAGVLSTDDLRRKVRMRPRAGRRHPLLASLYDLRNRRTFWRWAAIDVEADMFEHAGTPRAGKKRWDLAAVRNVQRRIDNSILKHEKALAKLAQEGQLGKNFKLKDPKPLKFPAPTGTVAISRLDDKWKSAVGTAKPIEPIAAPAHRQLVWAMPPERGRRTYHVTMAHAEAGALGAFYYVAYCDSTGDGRPDTPIARSAPARSERPAQWTAWSFVTRAKRVFIGHAWVNPDTAVFCTRTAGAQWRGSKLQAFIAAGLNEPPKHPVGPYIGNFRAYCVPAPLKPASHPATRPHGDR